MLAISDIHGNLPFLKGVLAAPITAPDDIPGAGDLVEKGPDSLTTPPVHHGAGGVEHGVQPAALRQPGERVWPPRGGRSGSTATMWTVAGPLSAGADGARRRLRDPGPESRPALREVVRARFGPELAFLGGHAGDPAHPDYLSSTHGGVADEAHLEG